MRAGFLLVVVLFAAVAAAAKSAATPTRGEFIRQGDAICAQVKRELAPVVARAEKARSLPESRKWAEAAEIWADQIAIHRRFVSRFRALGTPRNDRAAQRIVAALERGLVLAGRVRRTIATRNTAVIAGSLAAYVEFTVSTNKRVVAYGFRVCGR